MTETNGPLRRLASWLCMLQRIVDLLIIIGAQALAHAIYHERWRDQTTTITVIALLVFGFAAELSGLYRPWRGETAEVEKMEERVRHDMDYIRNWNLFLDLKIILLTIFGAKKRQNAC